MQPESEGRQRRRPEFIEVAGEREDPVDELRRGLAAERPYIAPRYFYDRLGSRLFEAICELPEYYLPRAEREIMDAHGAELAAAIGPNCTLIDLGAGNCEKAERLFSLLAPAQYVAVDVSVDFLREKLECLQDRHPRLQIVGLGQDFSRRLVLPPPVRRERRLFFYPGSSIGNFSPREAAEFVDRIRASCDSDGKLLLGVDLVKDNAVLQAAYDDPLGVTAAFNLNVLNNVNRILGSNFDVRDWRHVAFFDERESRVEMHLEAVRDVSVELGPSLRNFLSGERIHTENSYKFTLDGVRELMGRQPSPLFRCLLDKQRKFAVALS